MRKEDGDKKTIISSRKKNSKEAKGEEDEEEEEKGKERSITNQLDMEEVDAQRLAGRQSKR